MKNQRNDFSFSDMVEPHKQRTKDILKSHPEVRKLIGRNPLSFLIILFVVTLQASIAIALSGQPFWIALIVAYLIGAIANHCLYVLIHEASHNLIFKGKELNYISGIMLYI